MKSNIPFPSNNANSECCRNTLSGKINTVTSFGNRKDVGRIASYCVNVISVAIGELQKK